MPAKIFFRKSSKKFIKQKKYDSRCKLRSAQRRVMIMEKVGNYKKIFLVLIILKDSQDKNIYNV